MKLKFRESSVSILSQNDYCARLQKIDSEDLFLLFCVLRLPGRARTGGVSLWLRMGEEIEVWAWEPEKWPLYKSIQNAFFIVVCDNSATKRAFIITKATKWFSRQTEKVDTILVTKVRKMFWFLVLYKQREILNHSPSLKRGRKNKTFLFSFSASSSLPQLFCNCAGTTRGHKGKSNHT